MEQSQVLTQEQKALQINLDNYIYGTFAEIGAGQEVARLFFQVGAAAGTIAKTMSAYDKTYSDAIYGAEPSGRYVCRPRIDNMLEHEYGLMVERLQDVRPNTKFFVFADTVAAINYQKTIKGQGWLGLRFQLSPDSKPNDLIIHTKMLDNDNKLQQEAIGMLGVNMIYGAYYHSDNPEKLIASLIDNLRERVEIDMVSLKGPDFKDFDQRLIALYLVRNTMTNVAMFDEFGEMTHASEHLYKKHLMVVRGHYRPPTKVTLDVFESGFKQFKTQPVVEEERARLVAEITLENLIVDGKTNEEDFLMRTKMLNGLGQKVFISDCNNHQKLINYLSDYKIKNLGLVIGAHELNHIINEKYQLNQDGRLLVAFGELFNRNIIIYVYPAYDDNGNLMTAESLPVPQGIHFLYKHLLDCKQIIPIHNFNRELLKIQPTVVISDLLSGEDDWEDKLPPDVIKVIKENNYFGRRPALA